MHKLSHAELMQQRLTEHQVRGTPRFPVTMVLQNVRSRYNVGSIFRSADAFRINRLVLTGFTPAPPSAEISKTALGSERTVPFVHIPDIHEAITNLEQDNHTIVALELAEPSVRLTDVVSEQYPLAIIVGNELTGITDDVLHRCSAAITIPMYGVKHSLNVAVAAGIAMYQLTLRLP
ncbi:MAG: tRNA (guanosine(18)-2'-O)-methyltransferase [Chlorobi bacterium]|nr:MAG: tRNA/rRNA methyltransferase (SpoU) [Chlorobi bacterium OLB6]MBV6462596.1 tRNA (guanosine(18)-2'-O)-methyltransferase [Chlorobiota bacterium]WKZ77136.1 MAG: TrmH family RNA methyltransferase [Candidatus Kapabacteria bacterium]